MTAPNNLARQGSAGQRVPCDGGYLGKGRGPGVHGAVHIHGRELALGLPVGASVPGGYGDTGFQASGIVFPSAGCYQITG
jgi:hypothetical protein